MAASPGAQQHARPRSRSEFQIAIVCALEVESTAARALFDCIWEHPSYGKAPNDSNSYTPGRIDGHNVVLAYLSRMGSTAAAHAVSNLSKSYPSVNLALIVGVCGGAPKGEDGKEMILGDVVISDAIVQYAFGRRYADRLRPKNTLQDALPRPTREILAFLHKLKSHRVELAQRVHSLLEAVMTESSFSEWKRPPPESDMLFQSSYRHKHQTPGHCETCDSCKQPRDPVCDDALQASCSDLGCDQTHHVSRYRIQKSAEANTSTSSVIHFGTVASADEVMKSAVDRDTIIQEEGAIAFEMEGAGAWGDMSTVIVKGVCDYADSHKNKGWQRYAAMIAACCTKALLEYRESVDLQSSMSSLSIAGTSSNNSISSKQDQRNAENPREYFKLPKSRIRYFQGRTDELLKIDEILCSSQENGVRVCLIQGMGGQGKTQLALEYCRQKRSNPFECILWLDASSEAALTTDLEAAAEELFQLPAGISTSREAQVKFVLRKLTSLSMQWLVVFDNYDNVDAFDNIQDYFPEGDKGAILVTSRNAATCHFVQDQINDRILLGGLDSSSAIALLFRQSGIARTESSEAEGMLVVRRLGNHALAIVQAAPFIKRLRGLDGFLDYYERQRKSILQTAPKLLQYRRKLDEGEREKVLSVFTTWELSFRQLESQVDATGFEADFLTMLSLLDHNDISEEIFRAYPQEIFRQSGFRGVDVLESFFNGESWNSDRFVETATRISDLSLLQILDSAEEETCHLSLHPLIKDWLKLRSTPEGLEEMYHVVATTIGIFLVNSYSEDESRMPLPKKKHITIHVEALETSRKELAINDGVLSAIRDMETLVLAQRSIANFILLMGFFSLAECLMERAWQLSRTTFGEEHPETIACQSSLVHAYPEQGRPEDAIKLATKLLEKSIRLLGEKHPTTLNITRGLVVAHSTSGHWAEAEKICAPLFETTKRVLGQNDPQTLRTMGNLSSIYWKQGQLEKAAFLNTQVLETRRRVLGEANPDTIASMLNLANILYDSGALEKAEELGLQVLDWSKQVLGEEHPETLKSISNLAVTYSGRGKWGMAETLGLRVIEILRRILGEEHPETLTARSNLALTYSRQGRWKDAEEVERRTLEDKTRVLGKEHPETLLSMSNVMVIYTNQAKLAEAEALGLEALEKQKRVLGEQHPSTLLTSNSLAVVYHRQKRWSDAVLLGEHTLNVQKRTLGEDHPKTLNSLANLAVYYSEQGRNMEAEQLEVRTLEISKRILGEARPDTLFWMNNLAASYWELGRREEAAALMLQVVERRKAVIGAQHPDARDSVDSLLTIYKRLERWQEAAALEAELQGTAHTP